MTAAECEGGRAQQQVMRTEGLCVDVMRTKRGKCSKLFAFRRRKQKEKLELSGRAEAE